MKNVTIEMVQAMGYKELQATAKEFGIKANQKKTVLVDAIIAAIPVEEVVETVEAGKVSDAQQALANSIDTHYPVELMISYEAMEALMFMELDAYSPLHELRDDLEDVFRKASHVRKYAWLGKTAPLLKQETMEEEEVVEEPIVEPVAEPIVVDDDDDDLFGEDDDDLFGDDDEVLEADELEEDEIVIEEPVVQEPVVEPEPVVHQEPVVSNKVFEFVKADNAVVTFRQKGVEVSIGWSKKDFRCYMVKNRQAQFFSVQQAINGMKQFANGVHGDVAQIVKALVRIKSKPSVITAMEQRAKRAANTETSQVAKPSRSKYVAIDAQWHEAYKAQQGESYDARLVRKAYEDYVTAQQQ